jgi:hypothetical protein
MTSLQRYSCVTKIKPMSNLGNFFKTAPSPINLRHKAGWYTETGVCLISDLI